MNKVLHRYGIWILLASAVGCWWLGRTKGATLPEADRIDPQVFKSPVQTATDKHAFNVKLGDRPYRVSPKYSYDIRGLVVSEHESDSLLDVYHRMTGDFFNVCDLAMVWGVNAKTGIYKKGKFRNQDFTAWVQYDESQDWYAFRMNEFSNNHLITEDSAIRRKLKSIRIGDQVSIKGWLAEYFSPPDYHRGTSTTREDTGGRACETIYVTEVNIIQSANTGWRMMHTVGKVMAITILGIQVLAFLSKWRSWNRLPS